MDSRLILLVDDDQDILDSVAEVLRHHAFIVVTAASVLDAKKVLAYCKVDVIVADLELGGDESGEVLLDYAASQFPSAGRILHSSASVPPEGSGYVVVDKPDIESLLRVVRGMEIARRPSEGHPSIDTPQGPLVATMGLPIEDEPSEVSPGDAPDRTGAFRPHLKRDEAD
jgi:CheY-like chemotaxis protein